MKSTFSVEALHNDEWGLYNEHNFLLSALGDKKSPWHVFPEWNIISSLLASGVDWQVGIGIDIAGDFGQSSDEKEFSKSFQTV